MAADLQVCCYYQEVGWALPAIKAAMNENGGHCPPYKTDESTPFHAVPDGVFITVRVQPRSSKNQVQGAANGSVKIRLNSPPVDGAANAALIDLLSKLFKIRKSAISILSGEKSRNKRVFVEGVSLVQVKETLLG